MNLDLLEFQVKDVSWGDKTYFEDNHLYINKDELKELILADEEIEAVELQLAYPGEKTRIVNALDFIDARCKAGDEGVIYPGISGKIGIPGIGKTHVLRNFLIAEVGSVKLQTTSSRYGGVLDMSGPGAELTPYSQNHVLCMQLSANTTSITANALAFKRVSMKVSKFLARKTLTKKPDNISNYSLDNCCQDKDKDLPRVGYVYITECHNDLKESYFYGTNSRYFLPFILHPNETKDGAMMCMSYQYSPGHRDHTFSMLNNPVIEDLYRRHNKELQFGGMIVANAHLEEDLKKTNAKFVAKLAKYTLDLDAVIITKEGGGHPVTDQMLCCQECEKAGVKTALIVEEVLSQDGSGLPVVWHTDYADLVISVGAHEEIRKLPAMERLIGSDDQAQMGEIEERLGGIPSALSVVGHTKNGALAF